MYVCMHVRMYACMYVCVYLCMYVCMYLCMYVGMHVYVRVSVCMYVFMYVCIYVCIYISITSAKSPAFCTTNFSTSPTNQTVLPQSPDCSCYLSRRLLAQHRSDCRYSLIYAHTTSRTFPTCDIKARPDKVTVPEALWD